MPGHQPRDGWIETRRIESALSAHFFCRHCSCPRCPSFWLNMQRPSRIGRWNSTRLDFGGMILLSLSWLRVLLVADWSIWSSRRVNCFLLSFSFSFSFSFSLWVFILVLPSADRELGRRRRPEMEKGAELSFFSGSMAHRSTQKLTNFSIEFGLKAPVNGDVRPSKFQCEDTTLLFFKNPNKI